ncbi:MAG: hypothetical protein KAI40_03225 [Desulfobacterales bacterium]|nr:hypothetical protein [Desulfobacterales bacterium]
MKIITNPATMFLLMTIIIMSSIHANAGSYSVQHDKITKLFQGNEEPTAVDAIWTADNIFKVGVFNDGSNRDGYAEYVCMVLKDYGFKGKNIYIQIIDIRKLNLNKKWVKLGETWCQ